MARTHPEGVPLRADYGDGSYRRCIVLEAGEGWARGELVDDFHHFAARIEHADGCVVAIAGEDVRVPWTTCPGAVRPLEALIGARLGRDFAQVGRHTDSRSQCTHLYDAACLAICHAARQRNGGAKTRRYDFVLPDRRDGSARPTLARDGERILDWQVSGLQIAEAWPREFAHQPLRGEAWNALFARISDPDLAEAAGVMRRAVFIGLGRQYDFEQIERASSFAPLVGAACHTFSAERVGEALRVHGSVRDFHGSPERMLERDTEAD